MTNKKSTKRMLLSSALALFLCFLLLLGTTYAWFTDSVTSANNIIKSGTFDVSMEWADGTKAVPAVDSTDWKDASAGAIFNSTLWEPGYVEVRHIKIANEGTLALKYQLSIVPNGDVSDLSDVIDVYYVDPAQQVADRTALNENNKLGTLTQVLKGLSDTASGNLKATENHTVTLALKMREDAGNEYENKSIGSSFSIVLLATQLTAEPDSFDDQYDKDSLYPEVSIGNTTKEENEEAAIKTEEEDVKVDIPAGAPAGNYSLEVTNKSVETDASGNTTLSMDINLKKDGVKVAVDGSIVYAVSVDIGAGLNLTKLIHDGVEISQFDYNPATGIVEFNVTHFSPFSFEYRDGNYAAAANGIGYANLNEAIAAGGEVILLNDVALEETITIPADAVVTVDLNGHTISHEKECTASYSMISNNGTLTVKDSVGGGKISFTDTSAGDPSFGWGSYTVANYGTLTVDGGTIEHLGTQNEPGNVVHMICAIWQYSGTTTINNGTISCPNYRSVRLWKGEMVINGGDFKGQVWVQAVDNTSVLTVNGGTFAPSAGDMSSLFITNSTYTVTLSITDGNFTTKVGMSKPIQCITGGTFAVDPSAYVAPGYEAAEENGVFTVSENVYVVSTMNELQNAVKEGALFIDAKGANLGDFYYDVVFKNGTVLRNAKFTYFYGGGAEGTVTFENCEFVSDHSYSAHFDNGDGSVIFNNCLFDGWNSFGTAIKNVEMNNCTFKKSYNYGVLRFYQNAQLNNCTVFESFEGIDNGEIAGTTIELTSCSGIEGKIFNNTYNGVVMVSTWIVDGVQLTDVPAW